jgi:hypothetical protein
MSRPFVPVAKIAFAVAFLAGIPALSAGAQGNKLYLTNRDKQGEISVVKNGVVINKKSQTSTTTSDAYALAVGTSIFTLGNINNESGREYDLSGNALGSQYFRTPTCCFYDGTTDGRQWNYTVTHGTNTATVYRANEDWSGAAPLFTVPFQSLGITYDLENNSLWLGSWLETSAMVYQFSLAGQMLSSFSLAGTGFGQGRVGALAYNPLDETLWMSDYRANPGRLYQFERDGTFLGSEDVPLPSGQTYANMFIGGEFEMVEPPMNMFA